MPAASLLALGFPPGNRGTVRARQTAAGEAPPAALGRRKPPLVSAGDEEAVSSMPRRSAAARGSASSPSEAATASRAPARRARAGAAASGSSTSARKPSPSSSCSASARRSSPRSARRPARTALRPRGRVAAQHRVLAGGGRVDAGEHAQQVVGRRLERPRRQGRARDQPCRRPGGVARARRRAPRSPARGSTPSSGRAPAEVLRASAASRVQAAAFERIVRGGVEDPGVAARAIEPLARADGRVVTRLGPARHQRGEAALLEQGGQPRASSSLTRSPGGRCPGT